LKDLVLGQAKINESLNKKVLANDKTFKTINIKIETLSSALNNQLSFNKMIETQLAQIAPAVPTTEPGKIWGQLEAPVENVSMVSTRWGNPSRRTLRTNHAGRPTHQRMNPWGGLTAARKGDPGAAIITCSIYNCYYDQALYDLTASVKIMPKVPTRMCLQLTDSTIRYPRGIVKNLLVRIKNSFIFTNFMILNMEGDLDV
jgi:hypothetical protein